MLSRSPLWTQRYEIGWNNTVQTLWSARRCLWGGVGGEGHWDVREKVVHGDPHLSVLGLADAATIIATHNAAGHSRW